MGIVVYENSISLDGFVAGPNDSPENGMGDGGMRLFDWYQQGDVEVPLPGTDMVFRVSQASAAFMQAEWARLGTMLVGRRTFDIAHGWGGFPPGGEHCFVLTHNPPQEWLNAGSPFTFVTDGIASAVRQARALAGDKSVSIASASIARQCIKAGLLDEIILNVTPNILGAGVQLFQHLPPVQLEQVASVAGLGVTHLKYRVIQ